MIMGLVLHFGASSFAASVDGDGRKHLHIPDLPLDDRLADALALGGVVHENGHFDGTDFEVMAVANEIPREGQLANILEDVRTEAQQVAKFPGARSALGKMVGAMVEQGQFAVGSTDEGLSLVPWYVLYRLVADVWANCRSNPLPFRPRT